MGQAAKESRVLGNHSAAELARIVGVSPALVRRYALAGILGDGGRFGFADVVQMRAIVALREARISSTRIRRAMLRLRDQLPAGAPVSAAVIGAEGGRIVARYGEDVWDLESGQRVLDLVDPGTSSTSANVTQVDGRPRTQETPVADRVDDWFELALSCEEEDPEQAEKLYRRVLALDLDHPNAHLNLGRLLHERGDLYHAERHYRRAIAVRDENATAWFNLGVVLEDRGHQSAAVEAYLRATGLDEDHSDAFYNLGNLYETLDQPQEAVRCLKRYRQLTRS